MGRSCSLIAANRQDSDAPPAFHQLTAWSKSRMWASVLKAATMRAVSALAEMHAGIARKAIAASESSRLAVSSWALGAVTPRIGQHTGFAKETCAGESFRHHHHA